MRQIAHTCAMICLAMGIAIVSLAAAAEENAPNRPGSAAVVLYPDRPYDGPPREDIDEYGGCTKIKGKATGFFHLEQIDGRWWYITPKGNAFFSLGVRDIPSDGSAQRFRSWGFNCSYVGFERPDTANDAFPYVLNLKFIKRAPRRLATHQRPGVPPWHTYFDVFDPEWKVKCQEHADKYLKPYANDPLMVGYWIDNEPSFSGWYEAATHTDLDAPARKAFVEIARTYYADKPGQLEKDWAKYGVKTVDDLLKVEGDPPRVSGLSEAWQLAIAEETFKTIHDIARKVDPNHLNLGVRMMSDNPPIPGVLATMGKYVDVVSLNLYSVLPDRILTPIFTVAPLIHGFTGKPLMVSEFSYRGGDTLCPNTIGAPPTVPTQTDRAIGYLSYVSAVSSMPFFVGVNWYTYHDDDPVRAWEKYGEDSNFGIVDRQERPYAALTESMRITNSAIYELAADPVKNKECPLFWRTELMRWDIPWNQQFIMRFMGSKKPFIEPLANMLPAERRYHESYWVHHESPGLIINDPRFVGDCQANMIQKQAGGLRLALLGMRYFTSFPRALWLGANCGEPDEPLTLQSNVQVLVRDVADDGKVRRLTAVDGSFAMIGHGAPEFRTDAKVPYLDLRFDHGAKTLAIVTRGYLNHLGVRDVSGWAATWNGAQAAQSDLPAPEGVTVFAHP